MQLSTVINTQSVLVSINEQADINLKSKVYTVINMNCLA